MKRSIFLRAGLLLLASFGILTAGAQQTPKKHVIETDYLLYLPQGYDQNDTTRQWPVVVFLHGAGETGTDLEKVKTHGPPKMIAAGHQFPAIVVSPQVRSYGWKPDRLIELVQDVMQTYRTDPERIYLTGISMGGFGTWQTAQEYPGFFAAIIPICGGGNPEKMYTLANTPVWCFHGEKDNIVSVDQSKQSMEALRKFNPDAKLTLYPEAFHDSWTETYDNPEVFDWLFAQRRFHYTEKQIDPQILQSYAGTYGNEHNTFELKAQGNTLRLWREDQELMTWTPASEDTFFPAPGQWELFMKFAHNGAGAVEGFTVYYPNGMQELKKLK